jgi:HEAT repeat protein
VDDDDAGGVQHTLHGLADQAREAPRPAAQRGVAPGNWGAPAAVPALAIALNDEEPLVRGHAAWALGRIGTEAARQALRGRLEMEADALVREEIAAALGPGQTGSATR